MLCCVYYSVFLVLNSYFCLMCFFGAIVSSSALVFVDFFDIDVREYFVKIKILK